MRRIELILWKEEMVICGYCGARVKARARKPGGSITFRKVYVGDLEETPHSALCEKCMELEKKAVAKGKALPDYPKPKKGAKK